MSKNVNSSYQGFRRKNSLNSTQIQKNSSASDLTTLKFRHNEHLHEVQNLSMQLDIFSKRSLSSRSHCEERSKHTQSSTNFGQIQEGVTQNRFFHPIRKEEQVPKRKLEYLQEKTEKPTPKERRQKVSNSAVFNKFDVIEEDHYLNQQEEVIDQIEPVTFKLNPSAKLADKKGVNSNKIAQIKSNALLQPVKKTVNTMKIESLGTVKKDKIKLELNELDKMQKELDIKRIGRENNTTRAQPNTNILRRGKDAGLDLKGSAKMGRAVAVPQTEHKQLSEHRAKPMKSSANILMSTKMSESKHDHTLDDIQLVKEECIPTRMLNQKEKSLLIMRVELLRQIIQKNDICSESLPEISNHFTKIQKLMTK